MAATLAIAKAIKKLGPPRRSVILAFWDAEEDGLVGSAYYAANPLVPNAAVKGYINFDIQGANLLPSVKTVSFAVGAETGGSPFQAFVDDAVQAEGLDTQLLSYIFGQLRSDYVNLVAVGIPTVFFTDANNGCYHTVNDDVKFVDFKKLQARRRTSRSAPRWRSPRRARRRPSPAPTATLAHVRRPPARSPRRPRRSGRPRASSARPIRRCCSSLDTTLQALVADGPAPFDAGDVGTLLGSAINVVNALRRVPCQKF